MVACKLVAALAATSTVVLFALIGFRSPLQPPETPSARRALAKPGMNPSQAYKEGYSEAEPKYSSMLDVLLAWNPDDPTKPSSKPAADTLEVLDWTKPEDRARAVELRDLEIPFKLIKLQNVDEVVAKWKDDDYVLSSMDQRSRHMVNKAHNAHFMYYPNNAMNKELRGNLRPRSGYASAAEAAEAYKSQGYTFEHPPPVPVPMTFREFWEESSRLEAENKGKPPAEEAESAHIYLTTGDSWQGQGETMIGNDVKLFSDPETRDFFLVDKKDIRGQHCRFGMRGVVAEQHWDGHRNYIYMLRGAKRYVLNPPRACLYMKMMHSGPSRRHAAIDFSSPEELSDPEAAAQLDKAETVETVLAEGELLYVPSYWLHYIVSLGRSIQCNTRSGVSPLFAEDAANIHKCETGVGPAPATPAEKDAAMAKVEARMDDFRLPVSRR